MTTIRDVCVAGVDDACSMRTVARPRARPVSEEESSTGIRKRLVERTLGIGDVVSRFRQLDV